MTGWALTDGKVSGVADDGKVSGVADDVRVPPGPARGVGFMVQGSGLRS